MKSVYQEWWIWKSFVEIPWLECKSEWRGWSSQVKTEKGYFNEKLLMKQKILAVNIWKNYLFSLNLERGVKD